MKEEIEELLYREQLTLAPVWKRGVAFFVDELLLSMILLVVLWDQFSQITTMQESIAFTNSFVLEYMLMKIAYQTFFVHMYGATLGKLFMKIEVVEIRTLSHPSILCSFNRAVFRVISESIFYLGFLWGIISPEKQAWHDLSAKTLVIDA